MEVVSQTRVSGGNRTHNPHANSLAHHPLDYQGTVFIYLSITLQLEIIYMVAKYLFFWKMLKQNLLNIFSNSVFLFESTILPVNNGK